MAQEKQNKTYIGATLYPWQKAVTDEICGIPNENKVVVVKSHRQAGKSFLCVNILLYYGINKKRSTNAMISPTLNQSRALFKELVNAIIDSGVVKAKNETLLTIDLINGSTIFFKSSEQRDALRGYHINGILILDEAAYLSEDMLQLVLPWRNVSKANMLVVSTPFRKDGFFYRYYLLGVSKEKNTVSVDWSQFDTSALLNEEQKKVYKEILTKNQYLTEIEGEFIDGDGMVFSNILANVGSPQEGYRYYAGIDFGTGKEGDSTSISIFNEYGEMVYIHYFNDLGTFEQIDVLANDLIRYKDKIVSIYAENNSIGEPLTDVLKKTLREKGNGEMIGYIEEINTTNQLKVTMVSQVQIGLEQGKIKLLNDSRLLNELAAYAATYNSKTGSVSYNAPAGLHDDTVISTMLGYHAYKNATDYAQYKIGFVKNNRPKRR